MKLVSFDTDNTTDYNAITKILKSQSSWAHISSSAWLVGGSLTYKQLRDMLDPFNPQHLVVIAFDYENWATSGCSKDINDFIRNHEDDW